MVTCFSLWAYIITNVRVLLIVLNVNLFWLYLSSNFTMREIRSLEQNSDLVSALSITGNRLCSATRKFLQGLCASVSHLKMKRLIR